MQMAKCKLKNAEAQFRICNLQFAICILQSPVRKPLASAQTWDGGQMRHQTKHHSNGEVHGAMKKCTARIEIERRKSGECAGREDGDYQDNHLKYLQAFFHSVGPEETVAQEPEYTPQQSVDKPAGKRTNDQARPAVGF